MISNEKLNAIVKKHAAKSGVKSIAVENFLSTIDTNMSKMEHYANLSMDAGCYKWSAKTVAAIRAGIDEIYKSL
jgi:hypothetical protein